MFKQYLFEIIQFDFLQTYIPYKSTSLFYSFRRKLLIITSGIILSNPLLCQTFTNVATNNPTHAGIDAGISGDKDGGLSWGDINKDGFLDLVVNTNSASTGTRILIADTSDAANPRFRDSTSTYCNHCGTTRRERCAVLADFNHDGYLDLVRNTSRSEVNIYLNQGPSGNYHFGVGSNNDPNKTIVNTDFHDNQMNTEGILAADYNNDGWLDLIIENHNFGVDIFENPKDSTANFFCLDPSITLLPTSARDGDYAAAADVDDDGDIDFVARKRDQADFFLNNANSTFTTGQEIGNANNSNKGGVVFGDFDNDGDFDLYWTDNDVNQIWLMDSTGQFTPTKVGSADGEPWNSAGISAPSSTIDGCAVGDVNNDGKLDLFLTANSGTSYLFMNQTTNGGILSFVQNNKGINVNGNGEGCSFADYDNDGDIDLYVNVKNAANQLWRNDLNDTGKADFLVIEPKIDLGNGKTRAALGTNLILKDANNNILAGIREVPTTSGHGTDAPDQIHFGLVSGPDSIYTVELSFPTINGVRKVIQQQIVPSASPSHVFQISHTDEDVMIGVLPIEWISFSAYQEFSDIRLSWTTSQEVNSDYYQVERSIDGLSYQPLGQVKSKTKKKKTTHYTFVDPSGSQFNTSHLLYRIKHVDMDGMFAYSKVISLAQRSPRIAPLEINIQSDSILSQTSLKIHGMNGQVAKVQAISLSGAVIWSSITRENNIPLPIKDWANGIYMIQVQVGKKILSQKVSIK